jgi:FtsZ-binding cell division protein ZapB
MVLVMALLLTFSLVWSYIERVRLTGQVADVQKEAQTELAFLKQRERELASRNQEFEKQIADLSRRNEQLKAELEELRQRRQAAAPTILSFLLAPASVRREKAIPRSAITLLTGRSRLLMELDHNYYANYQIILQTVEGRELLRSRIGKVRFGKDRAFATLPVKAGELTKGDYILILFGQTADGKIEEIDRYSFRMS